MSIIFDMIIRTRLYVNTPVIVVSVIKSNGKKAVRITSYRSTLSTQIDRREVSH
jgi:hypothetical protein